MATFFTSDLHLQHANIIKYCKRPFKNVDEMDQAILDRRNAVVTDNDDVYLLGDVTLADQYKHPKSVARVREILRQSKGITHIIPGNHDRAGTLRELDTLENVRIHAPYKELYVDDQLVVMCHYPMLVWNKAHHGSYMLHGHSHGTLKYPVPGRIMDVGVDVHDFTPISYEQVKAKLDLFPVSKHHDV